MRRSTLIASLVLVAVSAAGAQTPIPAPPRLPGARGDFLVTFLQIERKFISLAEAMPVDKFNYTPGAGVRTFCEVLVHISAENYDLGKAFGVPPAPKELANAEATKCYADKVTVVAVMKKSFADIKTGVNNTKDTDLETPFTLFGSAQPKRAWLMATAEHAGEHLGQLIAYARVNGIVPPWSK